MLVLTRKNNESVVAIINDKIVKFTILRSEGNGYKVGVHADDDVIIHREEVYQKLLKKKAS
jgi:carbon storage regulator CsrA